MTRKPERTAKSGTYDPSDLRRHLYQQSAVFTRTAHALKAAAQQLSEAHGNDYARAAVDIRTAALVAMHAAPSAHQLVGAYELADWLEAGREPEKLKRS